jgi:hypothetical protein
MPGKDFLALMQHVGFHRAHLECYTGFKSAPETEGALFYGEKNIDTKLRETIETQAPGMTEPKRGDDAGKPGST